MRGQSFVNFLREEEGKADRQKVLTLSALFGSSVLAQLMFAGVADAAGCPNGLVLCGTCPSTCTAGRCIAGVQGCWD